MCLLLVMVIIIPAAKLISYAGQKSLTAYTATASFFASHSFGDVLTSDFVKSGPLRYLNLDKINSGNEAFQSVILETSKKLSTVFLDGATIVFKETTRFIVSLSLIILTMFFFFVDGKKMLKRLMVLSPLSNKHDKIIFKKFRKVSYAIFVSTFVASIAQGVVGAIGFAIVGFPAFLAGVMIALLSLLPYVGSMIFYVPIGLFYLLSGDIWQGIFVLSWGFFIIGTIDNIIRAYMIKDDAEVNPIFVLFSILGGISLFGFWGVILGPLIIALMVTIFHIYELEFCDALEGENCQVLRNESHDLLNEDSENSKKKKRKSK